MAPESPCCGPRARPSPAPIGHRDAPGPPPQAPGPTVTDLEQKGRREAARRETCSRPPGRALRPAPGGRAGGGGGRHDGQHRGHHGQGACGSPRSPSLRGAPSPARRPPAPQGHWARGCPRRVGAGRRPPRGARRGGAAGQGRGRGLQSPGPAPGAPEAPGYVMLWLGEPSMTCTPTPIPSPAPSRRGGRGRRRGPGGVWWRAVGEGAVGGGGGRRRAPRTRRGGLTGRAGGPLLSSPPWWRVGSARR